MAGAGSCRHFDTARGAEVNSDPVGMPERSCGKLLVAVTEDRINIELPRWKLLRRGVGDGLHMRRV